MIYCNIFFWLKYKLIDSWRSIRSLENTISDLRFELPANQSSVEVNHNDVHANKTDGSKIEEGKKMFMVTWINAAFSSRKRHDSITEKWVPKGTRFIFFFTEFLLIYCLFFCWKWLNLYVFWPGEKLLQLEKEKGIVGGFMIGHTCNYLYYSKLAYYLR